MIAPGVPGTHDTTQLGKKMDFLIGNSLDYCPDTQASQFLFLYSFARVLFCEFIIVVFLKTLSMDFHTVIYRIPVHLYSNRVIPFPYQHGSNKPYRNRKRNNLSSVR